jgi:PHP family Zn ribbon phosphoesterase
MGISEYELRQLLYFHYNDLSSFTVDDVLRKAKMSLNRNTTREEIEKLLDNLQADSVLSKSGGEIRLSKKLHRSRCTNCTFVFYLSDPVKCPNCGGSLQALD